MMKPNMSNFLAIPFQAIKEKSFAGLFITVMGLMLLAGSLCLMAPAAAIAEISVTVTGDGVTTPKTFTQAELEAMPQVGPRLYSTINTWPTKNWYMAEGPKLITLLETAGIKAEAKIIKVKSADGFLAIFTKKELLEDERYYYPGLKDNHEFFGYIPGSPREAELVEPVLALNSVAGDNPAYMSGGDAPLLVFGQRWITEQTNQAFAKKVSEIEVSTAAPGQWANPTASQPGGVVAAGTRVELQREFNDADKVYYTTDGTDPTLESPIYNWIASRWWGSRSDVLATINHPIEINQNTTIKAKTIGLGREDSDIVTFNYQVLLDPAPLLITDSSNKIVGQSVYLAFTDDPTWRQAIREMKVNDTALGVGQYSRDTPGMITINQDVFNAAGDYVIVIKATGYSDACATITITAPVMLESPTTGREFAPGEQVTIKGRAEVPLTSLQVKVTGPDGQTVYGPQDIELIGAEFETSFTLGPDTKAGLYTITLDGAGLPGTITSTFMVKADGTVIPPVGDVVLTITGSGVGKEVKFTLAELQGMEQYQQVYSAINTWPTKKWYVGKGVKLRDLLDLAGVRGSYGLIKFTADDGFTATLTVKELLYDTRYYFPNLKTGGDGDGHIPGSSEGGQLVEPMVALLAAEGTDNPGYMNDLDALLLMMGQRAVTEQTGQLFIKNLSNIEVLATNPSQWDTPQADPGSGEIPEGTLVKLSNDHMDDDKIYYTTDGTAPNIYSPMYNWIANRWWSSRTDVLDTINHPIEIKKDTTLKAITIGPGKMDSNVATFTYKVKPAITNAIEKISPDQDNTIRLGDEVTLIIPANALKETGEVEIKIEKVAPPDVPAGYRLAGNVYELSINGGSTYSFAKKVTLTISFDPEALGEDEIPAIYYYDEALGEWVNIGGTVNGNTITAEIDHFTKFTVMVTEKLTEVKIAVNLTDIAGHWAQKNIEQLVASGVAAGYPDGTFKPDHTMTRAEFVTMLVKAFNLENKDGKKFADTASHWAEDFIAGAVASGIVTGYDSVTFAPDDLITREQMAVAICKAAKLSMAAKGLGFADSNSISPWAQGAIAAVSGNGIMNGYPDNTFRPQGNATRAEAVTVIVNVLNRLNA